MGKPRRKAQLEKGSAELNYYTEYYLSRMPATIPLVRPQPQSDLMAPPKPAPGVAPVLRASIAAGLPLHEISPHEELFMFEADPTDRNVIAAQFVKYPLASLEKLNKAITGDAVASGERSLTSAQHGDAVAVLIDGALYRGCVCRTNGTSCTVYQIDFGVVCDVQIGALFPLERKYLAHPQVGLRCRLKESQRHVIASEEPFNVVNLRHVCLDRHGIDLYEFELESPQVEVVQVTNKAPINNEVCGAEAGLHNSDDQAMGQGRVDAEGHAGIISGVRAANTAALQGGTERSGTSEGTRTPASNVSSELNVTPVVSRKWIDAFVLALHPLGPNGEVRVVVQMLGPMDAVEALIVNHFIENLEHLDIVSDRQDGPCVGMSYLDLSAVHGQSPNGKWARVRRLEPWTTSRALFEIIDYGVRMMLNSWQVFHCPEELAVLPPATAQVCWSAEKFSSSVQIGQDVMLRAVRDEDSGNSSDYICVDVQMSK